ncbi:MAG: AAA family ATPase [Alphaproteobacteria bacterium]
MTPILNHFSLRDHPFALTPNPHLFFPSEHPQAMLAGLEFALMRGDGLLKITGAIGSGKTLLCRLLLDRLEALAVNTAYLNAPVTDPKYLPLIVAREFGVEPSDHCEPYRDLREFLLREFAHGRRNVLVIDEAQALGAQGLELVRLLSNLETETHKLLQIVLFGQKELDGLLARHDMRQVAQRITFSFSTRPLPRDQVAAYVRYRLQRCAEGYHGPDLFSPAAVKLLTAASRGWPRPINILADKALIAAYGAGGKRVERAHIRAAIGDTRHLPLPVPFLDRLIWRRNSA